MLPGSAACGGGSLEDSGLGIFTGSGRCAGSGKLAGAEFSAELVVDALTASGLGWTIAFASSMFAPAGGLGPACAPGLFVGSWSVGADGIVLACPRLRMARLSR